MTENDAKIVRKLLQKDVFTVDEVDELSRRTETILRIDKPDFFKNGERMYHWTTVQKAGINGQRARVGTIRR